MKKKFFFQKISAPESQCYDFDVHRRLTSYILIVLRLFKIMLTCYKVIGALKCCLKGRFLVT